MYFSADPYSPVFPDLRGLLAKTAGIADVLRSALAPLAASGSVAASFIYGSVAAARHTSESDVDLMVVGDARLSDLVPLLPAVEEKLGREVNPTIYRVKDFRAALGKPGHFVGRVLEGPRIVLVGTDSDVAALAGQRLADRPRHQPRRPPGTNDYTTTRTCTSGTTTPASPTHHPTRSTRRASPHPAPRPRRFPRSETRTGSG